MDDNRTRGWLLARLVLAIAVLTVIAIPLLARSEPISGLSSWESFGYRFGPIIAEAMAIAGLVWMLRIWRGGGRDSSAAWRYRVEGEPTSIAELRDDTPPDDRPIADTRARGWLVARLELVLAVVVVLVATIILVTNDPFALVTFDGQWQDGLPGLGRRLPIRRRGARDRRAGLDDPDLARPDPGRAPGVALPRVAIRRPRAPSSPRMPPATRVPRTGSRSTRSSVRPCPRGPRRRPRT